MTSTIDSATLLDKARAATDNAVVSRVFGEPVERDGIILLPVAKVAAGGGGGGGSGVAKPGDEAVSAPQQGEGSGAGYGLSAKPAGVFIIKNGDVSWKPAVDVNKVILGGQAVAVVALLVARSVLRRHLRRRR
ncbi:spore germination protein GerW family protein [Actinoplanes oblitus]|uniref:Spore germination protein GerW family protein n=1 Tax=Actinoplanes oblitus TaxID=3040509 RepID=A0ABY8W9Y6_9ACTN|nr:spore germination protein GerW family protein [Actinoplanes oblitus]WIM94172.1 spore germination protein GerW family protein [Actinoplanes oblitus]